MRSLLFGGTFDPPHNGHMDLLRNAIAAVQPQRVVVVPASVPPHKASAVTSPAVRLALCECFRPLFPGLEVSRIEMERSGKSYTIDTVRALRAETPDAAWYLSLGGDMLAYFTHWKDWQRLLGLATLVVQRRAGENADLEAMARTLEEAGGHVLFATGRAAEVSSTRIRQALAAGDDTALEQVPPLVKALIREHGLYR